MSHLYRHQYSLSTVLEFFKKLFESEGFIAHGKSYLWNTDVLWLNVVGDGFIALAFYSIPFFLILIARRRKDLKFHWLFLMFGAFIFACGTTHLLAIYTIWTPVYRLEAFLKILTAIASVGTALQLAYLIPYILIIPSQKQLEDQNKVLQREIEDRKQIEARLKGSEAKFRDLFENASDLMQFVALDERLLTTNDAWMATMGYSKDELAGLKLPDFIHPEWLEQFRAIRKRVVAGEDVGYFETCYLTKDKTPVILEGNLSCAYDKGKPIYTRGIFKNVTQRKLDEQSLKEYNKKLERSEHQIQTIFDNAPDAIIVMDNSGIIVKWNAMATHMFGWNAEEVLNQPLHQFIIPGRYREAHQKGLDHFKKTGEGPVLNRTIEITGLCKEGKELDVELRIAPTSILDDLYFIGFIRDVSERKKAQEKIRLYYHMIDNASDAIFSTDLEHNITSWNRAAAKIYGFEESEAIGKNMMSLLKTHFSDEEFDKMVNTLRERGIWRGEVKQYTKEGNQITVLSSRATVLDNQMNITGYVIVNHDISDRIIAEEKLRASESRFFGILDLAHDAIISFNEQNLITLFNQGAEKTFGYSTEEVIGLHISKLIPEYQSLTDSLQNGDNKHPYWIKEIQATKRNGNVFDVEATVSRLIEPDGITFTTILRDITERKAAEERLNNLNRALQHTNEHLKSFAYVASHDLREPLRKIQVFADRIEEREIDHLSESGKDYFDRMKSAARRMDTLIEDLLTYSRTSNMGESTSVDLGEIVRIVKSDLAVQIATSKAEIQSENLPVIFGIPVQLRQLFQNLLSNAIKFRKPGAAPRINITSEFVPRSEYDALGLNPGRDYVRIKVSDNGIGFDPVYANKIFELFQRLNPRRQYAGTGIGLSICKRVAENHGGFITAESKPGEGATFTVFIATIRL